MPRNLRDNLLSFMAIGLATVAVARAQAPTAPTTPPPIGGAGASGMPLRVVCLQFPASTMCLPRFL